MERAVGRELYLLGSAALLVVSCATYTPQPIAPPETAAAFDARIKVLVCWSGCYSLLDDLYLFCPHLQPTLRRILGGVSDLQARERLKLFTLEGAAAKIKCPTLITHGGADRLMSVEGAKRLFAALGSADKTLKIYDDSNAGGAIHCSHDDWAHNLPFMLDWLEERL